VRCSGPWFKNITKGPMYQSLSSVSDNHVHLICRDEEFEELPD